MSKKWRHRIRRVEKVARPIAEAVVVAATGGAGAAIVAAERAADAARKKAIDDKKAKKHAEEAQKLAMAAQAQDASALLTADASQQVGGPAPETAAGTIAPASPKPGDIVFKSASMVPSGMGGGGLMFAAALVVGLVLTLRK